MVDMRVILAGVALDNPVIPASGTFGFGKEFIEYYKERGQTLDMLGAISVKGMTRDARFGNETPRIAECTSGMINAVGLQNKGAMHIVEHELPEMCEYFHKPIIANISGFSVDEYEYIARLMDAEPQVEILEINVSCPNVSHGGMSFGTDPALAASVTSAVRNVTKKPVFIKLTPNVTDIVEIAKACEGAGADGISLINTLLGMRIDLKTKKPVIERKMGGFSGRAIFPVALRMVYQVAEAVKIPVMGMGGVASAEDVIEMMLAGATAVQVGAENLRNPCACLDIIEQLPAAMAKYGINRLADIIGGARQ